MIATTPMSSAALTLISAYQRFISPYKGFVCAYRAKNPKRSSCSQFGKRAIERLGLITGVTLIRRRFAKCQKAKQVRDYETPAPKERRPVLPFATSSNECAICGA
jgi:putative component of membrane protein insertase Oxa1/YidC/SpoIIIJ protein YidD